MTDDPRDLLGDELWDALDVPEPPPLSADFDDRFRARVGSERPVPRWAAWGTGLLVAAAMLAFVRLPVGPEVAPPEDPARSSADLALAADLEIVENLDLLSDFDVVMAWDGATP